MPVHLRQLLEEDEALSDAMKDTSETQHLGHTHQRDRTDAFTQAETTSVECQTESVGLSEQELAEAHLESLREQFAQQQQQFERQVRLLESQRLRLALLQENINLLSRLPPDTHTNFELVRLRESALRATQEDSADLAELEEPLAWEYPDTVTNYYRTTRNLVHEYQYADTADTASAEGYADEGDVGEDLRNTYTYPRSPDYALGNETWEEVGEDDGEEEEVEEIEPDPRSAQVELALSDLSTELDTTRGLQSLLEFLSAIETLFRSAGTETLGLTYEELVELVDVPRGVPAETIEQCTRIDYIPPDGTLPQCVICLCDFATDEDHVDELDAFFSHEQVRVLPCTHYFHPACIDRWLGVSPWCPVCKRDIRDTDLHGYL
eukprot:TRINITY_DN71381_c0_g1_i1.p1 TRINITY_DN71381_c0_g1~~TRINITY_DN71381_c0_g1_i1.p1  ORF type:complete len:379 (-),score=75.25 TRINITY_DN71381_c0_g1_i1:4-1140(-)